MDKYITQQPISKMKFDEKFANSRGSRGGKTFRKKRQPKKKHFVEPEKWVSEETEPSADIVNLKLTSANFPEINTNSSCKKSEENNNKISYSIEALFKKKQKKKKEKELKPGWIKLYYKDGKICQLSGPPAPPCYDAAKELIDIEIQKMIERHEFYEEWYQLNHYIPYWKKEYIIVEDELDYYPGDTESEEEEYEYEDDTDDDYDDI